MKRFEILAAAALAVSMAVPSTGADRVPMNMDEMYALALPADRAVRGGGSSSGEATEGIVSASDAEGARLWFVELRSKPSVEGTKESVLKSERAAFRAAARQAGIGLREQAEYGMLFNGFSVAATRTQLDAIRQLKQVKAVYPVMAMKLDEEADLFTGLGMTGAAIAQSNLGLTGYGVKVAVMDTGIDYDHPDLGGCFGAGCRVRRGYDFVGDAFNADPTSLSYNPIAVPDTDPDDCGGHGTHVAGIVGANGIVRGVAPEAELGAYRVFGCEGSTTAAIMLRAMEKILGDGNKVLNMSIGASFQWAQYPTAVAADRLANRGVIVVASAGNSGTSGLYATGAPGLGKNVINVASVDNTHALLTYFTVTSVGNFGYIPATGAPAPPTSGSLSLVRSGTQATTNDMCTAPAAGTYTGVAVLIRRGTCSFAIKAQNAQVGGAAAVVLYNNVNENLNATVAGGGITIPVVGLDQTQGNALDTAIAAVSPRTLTWTADQAPFANGLGGRVSSFSSYGPTPELDFKPEVMAPGGSIYSTWPLEAGGYAVLNGTSMASPHVAGAVALMLEGRGAMPWTRARAFLQNSADPVNFPGFSIPAQVIRQGAGLIDIDDSILSRFSVLPSRLPLGEFALNQAKTVPITIRNDGETDTFTLSHNAGIEVGGATNTPSLYLPGCATVSFNPASITVPRRTAKVVNVTVTENGCAGFQILFGGYIQMTGLTRPGSTAGPRVLRVPYTGFSGDYQAIVPMTPTANAFPWIARLSGGNLIKQTDGAVFSFVDDGVTDDRVYFIAHFEHQVRKVDFQIRLLGWTGWKSVATEHYLPRNSTATGWFNWVWNGRGPAGAYFEGTYDTRVCALKALGNLADPTHTQCIALPQIVIDRP